MSDSIFEVDRPEVIGPGAPVADYSSIVSVRGGRVLFIAGKGPVDANGKTVSDDLELQIRQAMTNMEAALTVAGAEFKDVVKVNAYFTTKDCIPFWKQVRLECLSKRVPRRHRHHRRRPRRRRLASRNRSLRRGPVAPSTAPFRFSGIGSRIHAVDF